MLNRSTGAAVVRFTPLGVEGMPDVTEVAIFPDRIELLAERRWVTFDFAGFARKQESRFAASARRLIGRRPLPHLVGARAFCETRRYITFYCDPPLKVFTPPDEHLDYETTYIGRINAVLRAGGYATDDLS